MMTAKSNASNRREPSDLGRTPIVSVHRASTGRRTRATPTAWSAPKSIQTLVKRLPNAPGVYRMFNAAGDVLYVGKARSLKKRVTNYAQGRGHTNRIAPDGSRDGARWNSSPPAPKPRRCCSKPT